MFTKKLKCSEKKMFRKCKNNVHREKNKVQKLENNVQREKNNVQKLENNVLREKNNVRAHVLVQNFSRA